MIEYDESGAIRICKFGDHQSIEQYNRKREQAAERQRRRRAKSAPVIEEPIIDPEKKQKPRQEKQDDDIPHAECIEIEKEWDKEYMKESKTKYVRTQKTLFRERTLLAPLIRAHGVDVVKARVRGYFEQPAKYNLRTVPKFCERYNGIPGTSPPIADYSDQLL